MQKGTLNNVTTMSADRLRRILEKEIVFKINWFQTVGSVSNKKKSSIKQEMYVPLENLGS